MNVRRSGRNVMWMVCERTGRWAAALRRAIARHASADGSQPFSDRIREFRALPQLRESLPKDRPVVVVVEAGDENLADILEFFSAEHDQNVRFAALIDESRGKSAENSKLIIRDRELVSDALFEAGAVQILASPRQIARLLPLASRLVQSGSCFGESARDYSIAALAKLVLPWQDD